MTYMTEINLSFQTSAHYSPGPVSDLPHENVFECRGRQLSIATRIQFEPDLLDHLIELLLCFSYHACGRVEGVSGVNITLILTAGSAPSTAGWFPNHTLFGLQCM